MPWPARINSQQTAGLPPYRLRLIRFHVNHLPCLLPSKLHMMAVDTIPAEWAPIHQPRHRRIKDTNMPVKSSSVRHHMAHMQAACPQMPALERWRLRGRSIAGLRVRGITGCSIPARGTGKGSSLENPNGRDPRRSFDDLPI